MDPARSMTDVESETDLKEKAFTAPGRAMSPRALSRLWGPPGLIIAGQLFLQALAWIFFGIVWTRGIVPIPSLGLPRAIWFKPLSFLFTNISHILATLSTFLFSWGVQQAIVQHLRAEGMSFETFLAGMSIASQSFIRDLKRKRWTVLSIIVYVACFEQTSGWNTLLTPQQFIFDDDIVGRDVNLSSTQLVQQFNSGTLDSCVFEISNYISLAVGQTESGFAALNGDQGLPTSTAVFDNNFNTSTGGIFPMAFSSLDSSVWFPDTTVFPPSLSPPGSLSFSRGLSWTWTMNQQGFTADVDCEFRNLNANTSPSLIITPDLPTTKVSPTEPTQYNISSNCPSYQQRNFSSQYAFAGDGQGFILMIACVNDDSYEFIFVGRGSLYSFLNTTVCTFVPRIPNVWTDYSWDSSSNLTTIETTTLLNGKPDINGPAAVSAVETIYNMMSFAQAISTNVVGDQLKSVLQNIGDSENAVHSALNEYLRGVAEYSGSVFRACLSARNGTAFPTGIPNEMTIVSRGTLHTEFFGWQFTTSSSWILLPGTFVGLATIYVVLKALAIHPREEERDGEDFEPGDPLDLIAASAAGGLSGEFSGGRQKREDRAKRMNIVLEHTPGYGLGFKHRGSVSYV